MICSTWICLLLFVCFCTGKIQVTLIMLFASRFYFSPLFNLSASISYFLSYIVPNYSSLLQSLTLDYSHKFSPNWSRHHLASTWIFYLTFSKYFIFIFFNIIEQVFRFACWLVLLCVQQMYFSCSYLFYYALAFKFSLEYCLSIVCVLWCVFLW